MALQYNDSLLHRKVVPVFETDVLYDILGKKVIRSMYVHFSARYLSNVRIKFYVCFVV